MVTCQYEVWILIVTSVMITSPGTPADIRITVEHQQPVYVCSNQSKLEIIHLTSRVVSQTISVLSWDCKTSKRQGICRCRNHSRKPVLLPPPSCEISCLHASVMVRTKTTSHEPTTDCPSSLQISTLLQSVLSECWIEGSIGQMLT